MLGKNISKDNEEWGLMGILGLGKVFTYTLESLRSCLPSNFTVLQGRTLSKFTKFDSGTLKHGLLHSIVAISM